MVQRSYDALLHLLALHGGRKELCAEGEGRVGELVHKIAITSGSGTGDDRDVKAEKRQRERLLHVEDSLGLQLGDDLLTATGHVAKGERGVYVGDDPRETVCLVELGINLQSHLHAGMQPLARHPLKQGLQHQPPRPPATSLRTCDGSSINSLPLGGRFMLRQAPQASPWAERVGAMAFILYQLHIAVAATLAALCQLGLHPVFPVEAALENLAHKAVEFKEGKSSHCSVFSFYLCHQILLSSAAISGSNSTSS